jgi:diguanylate cyclase (GGDEF)-like protein
MQREASRGQDRQILRSGEKASRSLSTLVGTVIAAGVVVVCAALVSVSLAGLALPGLFFGCLALVVGAYALPLRVRFGSDEIVHVWGEIPLVLGLYLLPHLSETLLITWLGVAIGHAANRRGPMKILYNAGATTVATLAAGGIYRMAPLPAHVVVRAAGLVVAALVFNSICDLAASGAIALSQGRPVRELVRDRAALHLLMSLGNVATALLLLALAEWRQAVLIVLPIGLALLHRAYAHRLDAAQEQDVWQRLDAATREINQLDRSRVLAVAARRAVELFRADTVDLLVADAGRDWLVRATASDVVAGPATDFVPPKVRVTRTLHTSARDIGEFRLGFRGTVTLTDRESRALSTYAHALSAALLNADLYEEMRAHADRKAYEAAHDPLTGLANRTVLLQQGEIAVTEARLTGTVTALLLLDLDHFKEVNDTLGHEAGDVLLCEVASRLAACVRDRDTVVRLGGDEFAVLVPGLRDTASAITVATNVAESLAAPISIDGLRLPVEWSIGVACAPDDAATIRELLRCADVAMYQAKRSAVSVQRYRMDHDPSSLDRLSLVAELPEAVRLGQLVLHFQPKVDLATGAEFGVEALVRWAHPRRGLLGADDFVSLAEHSGLVHQFTMHVIDLALAAAAANAGVPRWGSVAVNLSARNLLDRDLSAQIEAALRFHRVVPERLVLEITETVILSELEIVDQVLDDLRRLGVRLSVDDFGTGYSSLTFLSRTRLDEVKIDRSFVQNMLDYPGDAAIVRAILELAHALGMRVVAEGVETLEQEAALVALGCDAAQGFRFGRPLAPDNQPVTRSVRRA